MLFCFYPSVNKNSKWLYGRKEIGTRRLSPNLFWPDRGLVFECVTCFYSCYKTSRLLIPVNPWFREKNSFLKQPTEQSHNIAPLINLSLLLKGHSQLYDCADLDTSFSLFEKSLPQPKIKVHLEISFIFCSVLLDFQALTEKPVFECPFAHPMILFFIISGLKQYLSRPCYMQTSYGIL